MKYTTCKKCGRNVDVKKLTKDGCISCDANYHYKQARKEK